MVDRLLALQERGRPLINSGRAAASEIMQNDSLKKEIDALYQHYFGRAVTGCKNCYADALIELCSLKKSTAMSKTDLFVVRRGKVIKDNIDARNNLVRGNETDELALYHLYINPQAEEWFERLPEAETLKKMVAEFGKKYEAERNAKYGDGTGNTAADKVMNDAKAEAEKIKEKAEAEAAEIVKAAEAEAEKIVSDAKTKAAAGQTKKAAPAKAAKVDPILD